MDFGLDGGNGVRLIGRDEGDRLATLRADGREAWLDVAAAEPLTCVNGRPVRRMARMLAGDRVCFGDVCLDLVGNPSDDEDEEDPVSVYGLRRRSGIGSGSMLGGALIHLDRQGEPVSAAAGVVGLVLADGNVYLDPGDAEVRVNGHRVTAEVRVMDGDSLQVGRQRFAVEAHGSQVFQLPAFPDLPDHDEPPLPSSKRNQNGLGWLVVAAAAAAALLSALLYFSGGA